MSCVANHPDRCRHGVTTSRQMRPVMASKGSQHGQPLHLPFPNMVLITLAARTPHDLRVHSTLTHPPSFHPSSDPFSPVHSAIPTRLNADIPSSNPTNHAHAHPFILSPTPTSCIMPIPPSLLAAWFRSPPRLYRDPPTRQARQLLGSTESADPKVFQDSATTTAGADPGAAAATTPTTGSAGSTRHAGSGTRRGYVVAVVWPSLTPGSNGKAPAYSPNYREEAERIVAEERAQTEKMPRYEVRLALIVVASTNRRDWKGTSWLRRWATVHSPTCTKRSTARPTRNAPSRLCASMS